MLYLLYPTFVYIIQWVEKVLLPVKHGKMQVWACGVAGRTHKGYCLPLFDGISFLNQQLAAMGIHCVNSVIMLNNKINSVSDSCIFRLCDNAVGAGVNIVSYTSSYVNTIVG